MAVSEERLQLLVPRALKRRLMHAARRAGVSVGEYVRRLIEADSRRLSNERPEVFPFGERPLRTERTRGSIDHDRPE